MFPYLFSTKKNAMLFRALEFLGVQLDERYMSLNGFLKGMSGGHAIVRGCKKT